MPERKCPNIFLMMKHGDGSTIHHTLEPKEDVLRAPTIL
jgi:hypothetical protein